MDGNTKDSRSDEEGGVNSQEEGDERRSEVEDEAGANVETAGCFDLVSSCLFSLLRFSSTPFIKWLSHKFTEHSPNPKYSRKQIL